jgi:hypothetical protein
MFDEGRRGRSFVPFRRGAAARQLRVTKAKLASFGSTLISTVEVAHRDVLEIVRRIRWGRADQRPGSC